MDTDQEELQFIGFFGILKETFNIIQSCKKIFTQIALTLILPLSFIFLAHIQISQHLFTNIMQDEESLDYTQIGSLKYSQMKDLISSEWTYFWLFKAAYFSFLLFLSLLSTSAVVYTVAGIYTGKQISFKSVMSVVPKVWKRVVVTFLWSFAFILSYNVVAIAVAIVLIILAVAILGVVGIVIAAGICVLYLVGFVYISMVWHLASVVSVLEDVYGIKAMAKSKELIKGKTGIAGSMFVVLIFSFVGVEALFEREVVSSPDISVRIRVVIGMVCLLLLFMVILIELVAQTVIYFVCKSYHHENVDRSSLADHLEAYQWEYVPLKAKDIQMEQINV